MDASVPLASVKYEAFAQGLAKGLTNVAAHKAAGFGGDNGNASTAANLPEVRARVAFIREQFASMSRINDKRALEILAEIVLTPIGEIDQRHFLAQEYSETPGMHGTAIRIKMPSKLDALRIMGAWCGWEKGTQADRKAAEALGGVAELVARIRSAGRS